MPTTLHALTPRACVLWPDVQLMGYRIRNGFGTSVLLRMTLGSTTHKTKAVKGKLTLTPLDQSCTHPQSDARIVRSEGVPAPPRSVRGPHSLPHCSLCV